VTQALYLDERGVVRSRSCSAVRWDFPLVEELCRLLGLVLVTTQAEWAAQTVQASWRIVAVVNTDGKAFQSRVASLAEGNCRGLNKAQLADRNERTSKLMRLRNPKGSSNNHDTAQRVSASFLSTLREAGLFGAFELLAEFRMNTAALLADAGSPEASVVQLRTTDCCGARGMWSTASTLSDMKANALKGGATLCVFQTGPNNFIVWMVDASSLPAIDEYIAGGGSGHTVFQPYPRSKARSGLPLFMEPFRCVITDGAVPPALASRCKSFLATSRKRAVPVELSQ